MARTIVEYNIVTGETRPILVRHVSGAIRDGFEPLGSFVTLYDGFSFNGYGQAVVRYENEPEVDGPYMSGETSPGFRRDATVYQAEAARRLGSRPSDI